MGGNFKQAAPLLETTCSLFCHPDKCKYKCIICIAYMQKLHLRPFFFGEALESNSFEKILLWWLCSSSKSSILKRSYYKTVADKIPEKHDSSILKQTLNHLCRSLIKQLLIVKHSSNCTKYITRALQLTLCTITLNSWKSRFLFSCCVVLTEMKKCIINAKGAEGRNGRSHARSLFHAKHSALQTMCNHAIVQLCIMLSAHNS